MKISIVTVCYNSAATIADTLRSVARQGYQDIEHLVIDGRSVDRTIQVVEENHHPRLIVSSEPDGGIYDAMNKGLKRASGEIIGFLNSDDFYSDSSVLEDIAAAFQDESVEACYADLVYVTQDDGRIVRFWKSRPFVRGDFAYGWCPAHPTFYVRKSVFERLGFFDQRFKLAADAEFMMRCLELDEIKSLYIPRVIVRMRVGGASNQGWKNILQQNKEIFSAFRKNNVAFNPVTFFIHKILARIRQYLDARVF